MNGSDRDVFMFLCDDTNPIEADRLPNGEPDLYFRGFYAWNSEVGSKTLGIASFYLRAVCCNRNLWGCENFEEITIRHSKFAARRFAQEVAPALSSFANSSPTSFIAGIRAARERIVARNDEDRIDFLRKRGFPRPRPAESSKRCSRKKAALQRQYSILCKALPHSHAEKPIRTRVSNWKVKHENCLKVRADRTGYHPQFDLNPIARPLCRVFYILKRGQFHFRDQ